MSKFIRTSLAVVACTFIGASVASAQATRTWVSGVGDDANPCSRTAPCKTFAGAISKTAAGGEINALDPGGFGGVTITKSITINGTGTLAGLLVSGTNGISINAAATDSVVLKGLQVTNVGATAVTGIRVLSAKAVVVDDVIVQGFGTGIEVAAGNVIVNNSIIIRNSQFGVNAKAGTLSVDNSLLANNNVAVQASTTGAVQGTVRLSNNSIYNNLTGFGCGGGILASAANNRKAGNVGGVVAACTPTVAITIQ
jgi:hypothetical protein